MARERRCIVTSADRESLRIELARTMRDDPRNYPVGRLLDSATPDASGYHVPIDGICKCGRLLGPADTIVCADCEATS